MNIGNLKIEGHTVLAPLAGITNLPFRRIVKRCGCSLVCSEMVSVKGILYNSEKTFSLLETTPEEKPLSVQIFGSEPKEMAKAAKIVEQSTFHPSDLTTNTAANRVADVIDINFGCSVKKVVKTGAGVALMQNIANAEDVIRAVRDAISIPFTIKMRSGWDSSGIQAFKLAESAQKLGVDAITFHPRTASQGFKGKAEWSLIKELKSNISIPLIGNGDITSAEDGVRMIKETQCDAIMVGRAAMGNPFILSDIEHLLSEYDSKDKSSNSSDSQSFSDSQTKSYQNRSIDEIFSVMRELLKSSVDYFGEKPACKIMRSRLVWFVKGYPECSKFRQSLTKIESMNQTLDIIDNYQEFLANRQ